MLNKLSSKDGYTFMLMENWGNPLNISERHSKTMLQYSPLHNFSRYGQKQKQTNMKLLHTSCPGKSKSLEALTSKLSLLTPFL